MGFAHVCHIFKGDEEIATAEIQYINRTYEAFQFASVLSSAKAKLEAILNPEETLEIDTNFLSKLACEEIIYDYGVLHGTDNEYVIVMDSWEQAEGIKREWKEGEGYVECELKPSVYRKLYELAEQNKLKPSINYTMLNVEFVFSDEYVRCDECGKICNTYYGEASYVNEVDQMLCTDCATENDYILEAKIESAKENFKKAVPVEYSDEKIEGLGYSKINEDSYSMSMEMWGESRYGCDYIETELAQELCAYHDGFVKLDLIEQFDTQFSIYVPNNRLEKAKSDLELGMVVKDEEEPEIALI